VETGLLIDLLDKFGLRGIAQVDLQERVHHNQPLDALSRMSFAIIQVIVSRLEDRHKLSLLEEINRTMKIVRYEASRYYLDLEAIGDLQRPPMISIEEYRRARQIDR
jgi:glucosyl-3-phosphoglycerate synthase